MQHRQASWYYAMLVAAAVAGLVSAANLATDIGRPFGGFFATLSQTDNMWIVHAATPPWWPAMSSGQLRYDDQLVYLDNHPYGRDAAVQFARRYSAGSSNSVLMTVRRRGALTQVAAPIVLFTLGNFIDAKLSDIIVGLGFWLLGLTVLNAQSDNPVNRVFALGMSCTASALWLSIPGLFFDATLVTRLLQILWILPAAFVGVSFVHLTTLYPRPIRRQATPWIRGAYAVMAVFAFIYAGALVAQWLAPTSEITVVLLRYSNMIVIASFGLGVLFYIGRLARLLSLPDLSRRLRRQSAILALGAGLALPHVAIIVLRTILGSAQDYFALGLDMRYLTLAVPISFAFVILRYQTLRRIHPAVAGVFMLATSALLASVAAWVMREIEPSWANTLNVAPFLPLFLVALVTAIFYSLQNTLRGAFSRVFQWEFRSYSAVRRFTQQVIAQPDAASLPPAITNAAVEQIELECAAIWVVDEAGSQFVLEGQAGSWPNPPPSRLPFFDAAEAIRPFRLSASAGPTEAWLDALRGIDAIEIVAPLVAGGSAVGVLALGKRWDEEIFDNRDLDIMELVAQEAALFVLTARQIEALRRVPQQITAAQERERFKIAQELHDTVQQFLGRLPFYLEVSQKNARSNPAETESILQRCIIDVAAAAQAVRHIRSSLAPLQLESSLLAPLNNLLENFRGRTGLAVLAQMNPAADTLLSPEARHALYRVVQQALDNIATHAEATQVTVVIAVDDNRLSFSVVDNGRGIIPAKRKEAEARGSFGLISMNARITAVGGEFGFESAPGVGTTLRGWLPI